jgi:hypothetical protein
LIFGENILIVRSLFALSEGKYEGVSKTIFMEVEISRFCQLKIENCGIK